MEIQNKDSYWSISSKSVGEFKDKGSKFIGYALPFEKAENLKNHLDEIKSIHSKARHFCFAYKIGISNDNFRTNDDGEPSGSAGKPILNALLSKNLSDVLIIVVRYFGGTLLGIPGLINSYKSASLEAISNAEIIEKFVCKQFILKYDFEKTNEIMRIVKEFNLKILTQDYTNKYEMKIEIRQSNVEKVICKIEELRIEDLEISELLP